MKTLVTLFITIMLPVFALGEVNGYLFDGVVHWPIGIEPYDICMDDFNNDGYPDIVAACEGSYDISVILGGAKGMYSAPVSYPSDGSPCGVTSGYVDDDDFVDIVFADGYDAFLMLNNGDGSFGDTIRIDFPGSYSQEVSLADFNNDNYDDLVITNSDWSFDSVAIYINDQSGGFGAATTYQAGKYEYGVAAGYFNDDTHIDLAVISNDPEELTIMLNDGAGGFTSTSLAAVGRPYTVAVVELTGDSHDDLAVLCSSASAVRIYANDGAGGFTESSTIPVDNGLQDLAFGDFNNDGDPDFAVTEPTVQAYLNNGNGTFSKVLDAYVGQYPYALVVGDVNADGNDDIVVTAMPYDYEYDPAFAAVMLGKGDGTFAQADTHAMIDQMQSFCVLDIDNDNDNDIVGASWWKTNPDRLYVLENDGYGDFTFRQELATGGWKAWTIASADLNSDNYDDVVVGYSDGTIISVHLNDGAGNLGVATNYTVGDQPRSIFIADLDGDSDLDLAVANRNSSSISILKNNGSGAFAAAVNTSIGVPVIGLTGADMIGNDGYIDLVMADYQNDRLVLMRNDGTGSFTGPDMIATGNYPNDIAARDFDGDNDIDLAVVNYYDNDIMIFENDNHVSFMSPVSYAVGMEPTVLEAEDFDGDGDIDLAVVNGGDFNMTILYNDGNRVFTPALRYCVGEDTEALAVADFNGDGLTDIAANDYSNGAVLLYINRFASFLSCCEGRVGDANGLLGDEPTIGDVAILIDAKFISGTCVSIIACLAEGDINQSGGADPTCEDITIGDVAILIDYLFITGSSLGLPDCL